MKARMKLGKSAGRDKIGECKKTLQKCLIKHGMKDSVFNFFLRKSFLKFANNIRSSANARRTLLL